MIFSPTPMRVHTGETIFSSLAFALKTAESREDCVRKDLKQRLKSVCAAMSRSEFDALVSKMTTEQLRGERAVHGKTETS